MDATIKDIARLAGVSHTTVSRALNNSPLIQDSTKERIQLIAQELNYTPNFNAKSLVLERSYNLGLFFTTLSKGTSPGFYYEAIRGVNSVIQDRYHLVVKGIDDYTSFDSVTRKRFDGIIAVSQSNADQPFIQHAAGKGIPIVVLNRPVDMPGVMNILSEEEQGAFQAVSYLIASGHRDIALMEGRPGFRSAQKRQDGFERALRENGLSLRAECRFPGFYDLESGYRAMKQLIGLRPRPTAVFCCNDEMAIGAMKAASEEGLCVPDDMSVVGFDEMVYSAYTTPALTTVRRPIELISREGAVCLLRVLEDKIWTAEPVRVKTELIVRQSVARPAAEREL